MAGIINVVLEGIWWLVESVGRAIPTRIPNEDDIKNKNRELNKQVEEARGVIDKGECLNSAFIGKLIEAENYVDTVDYLIHNKLINNPGPNLKLDLNLIENHLDHLLGKQNANPSEQQSSDLLLDDVRRGLHSLPCFDTAFVFNLKRVSRLSVPNEVIPEKLKQLPEFLDIIKEASNHREKIQNFPELDNSSRKPCFEGIKSEQIKDSNPFPIFEVVTNIPDLPVTNITDLNFEPWKFMLLRYLSLRDVNLSSRADLDLNKLSSLKYLDLKHTKVKDCKSFECLEKLQMLDLRYTHVKEIPDKILKKLQHLLLGYIEDGSENQLASPKLDVTKLNSNLKTLRAIKQPDLIGQISNLSNLVDLSVTELETESLRTLWGFLEIFKNLTSLGVAVTNQSVITLKDCKDEQKKKLKRLRMEGSHSGLEELRDFEKLDDLTLANMVIGEIPDLPELLCLRLYGVCQEPTCKIELKMFGDLKKLVIGDMGMVETVPSSSAVLETVQQKVFGKLEKLVIGDMGMVETVQICSSVLETVVTLKFSNLPRLKEVAYTDEQPSDKPLSLLKWEKSKVQVCSEEVKPNKTIFLRHSGDFPVENSPGLEIYKYDKEMQCYKLNAT